MASDEMQLIGGSSPHVSKEDEASLQSVKLTDDHRQIISKNSLKRKEHLTNNLDTFIHLVKGDIDTGILALPLAIKNAGYIIGPIGILFIGFISMHCMVLLVQSANKLCEWNQLPALDYAETMQFALKERGASPRVAKIAKIIVNIFLIMTQFGICSVYFVFMGDNLKQVMETAFCITVSKEVWIAALIVPVILFTWIRDLDSLAPLSFFANVAMVTGIVVIFYDEIRLMATSNVLNGAAVRNPDNHLQAFGSIQTFLLFFGTTVFAFDGIGIVLPLENKMRKPQHAKYVIYSGMSLIIILYTVFGLTGYLTYGENIRESVTLNLCHNEFFKAILFLIAKLLFIFGIFVTYLLQFYVPIDFLEPALFTCLKLDSLNTKYNNVIQTVIQLSFRTILVLITASLALSIPDLADLISLIGAVAVMSLAIIFPPLIHMLTFWRQENKSCLSILPKPIWVAKNIAIITIGLLGAVFGTFASIVGIVDYFKNPRESMACLTLIHSSTCELN